MKILITGAAGFIGFHVVKKLVEQNIQVIGIDNINNYYDTDLKYARLSACGIEKQSIREGFPVQSTKYECYSFQKTDLTDTKNITDLFDREQFNVVINLAAQAGVRYSLINPYSYIQSNIVGFLNILENCRNHNIQHLIYASSSSVYGMNEKQPFSEDDQVDYPVSLYSATKKSDELMAHTYSHLYHLPTTGLRFFTVYGPWGRPDMSPMLFAKAILSGDPIKLFNNGDMIRDFTYIDDIVKGVAKVISHIPGENEQHPYYRILNIGNSEPVHIMQFIHTLEQVLGKKACFEMHPMQKGDVKETYADVKKLHALTDYKPTTKLESGLQSFASWYKGYYGVFKKLKFENVDK